MRNQKTLIQIQDEAKDAILSASVQTKASCMYGMTVLNRSRRTIGKIRRNYGKALAKLGVDEKQHSILWKDVCDMAVLEAVADSSNPSED
jgi:hypothetical protein